MNSILVGKDAQKVAVMDWGEEMSDRGYWVDLSWDADVRRCVAKVGKAGHGRALMSASGGTEITARIELMKAWAAINNE